MQTYKEKVLSIFDDQKVRNFKVHLNLEAIAEETGAKLVGYGIDQYLDFSETKYGSIKHPEVEEMIYESIWNMMTSLEKVEVDDIDEYVPI